MKISMEYQTFEEIFDCLLKIGCQFWACEGPDSPYESMKTCHRCFLIQKLKQMKVEKNET